MSNELIIAERRRAEFNYLTETIQGGRIKPAKYKHYIQMLVYLYEELRQRGVINPEDYYIDSSAFFQFKGEEAIISFINLYHAEDLHRRIDHYLVVKFAGSYPIKRGGSFF